VCVFIPVDVPFLTAEVLRLLASSCRDAAVPQTGPLPGAYRRTALPVLTRRLEAGQLALHDALPQLDTVVLDVDARLTTNVNTPEDLERVRRSMPAEPRA
jgi:molybdopterin-guanine dinucleotide biosynthesis protein A